MLTQAQLDDHIRKAKGHNAVEEMLHDDGFCQLYLLSNGEVLEVSKSTGDTWTYSKAKAMEHAKAARNQALVNKLRGAR